MSLLKMHDVRNMQFCCLSAVYFQKSAGISTVFYLVVFKTFSVLISEILISGNKGYSSERVEVFGLYCLWRLWTEKWWSTTDPVWWLWHLISYILYGSTSGLCPSWQLEMQMVNYSLFRWDFSDDFFVHNLRTHESIPVLFFPCGGHIKALTAGSLQECTCISIFPLCRFLESVIHNRYKVLMFCL